MNFQEYRDTVLKTGIDDYAALLNIGRKWEKIQASKPQNIKIGILGSASIQLITSVTRALLTRYDLCANIYEGEYNGILMDVLDVHSKLYEFAPEYIVILPDYHDIIENCPHVLATADEINKIIDRVLESYHKIYDSIHENLPGSQIVMSNFVEPYYDPMGNLEVNYLFSQKMFFRQINLKLTAERPSFVTIIDVESLAEYIGKRNWFDESAYFLNKFPFSLSYIGYFCDLIARQFEAFMGKARKCLVLDLDNTLWGGVVGDLGIEGIMLDPNDAEGEAYRAFQKYILGLKNRGVILAVCSKNDEAAAKEPFERNPNMLLKLDDFSAFVANWEDKATNIRRIANELNIGVDSMVFFDDNPTEREIVKEFVPGVKVIEVPVDPAYYVRTLDQAFAFEWNQVTREDIGRVQSYSDNRERNHLMETCVNYEDYLRKLDMSIECRSLEKAALSRFTQLTNKSNQFNVRTNRYSEAGILEMMKDPNCLLLTVALKDRFSNYGIISCIILKMTDQACFIENWVMSCRVLKKTVENYVIVKVVEAALKRNCEQVIGEYIPSKKNAMVSNLFEQLGFELTEETNGVKQYVLAKEQMNKYKQIYYFKEVHDETEGD